jgi:L-aspartate oxidase
MRFIFVMEIFSTLAHGASPAALRALARFKNYSYHTCCRSKRAMTSSPTTYHADYVVVGSGVAGLRAAIELSSAGSVLVLAKSTLSDSATAWAQGGIAVALSDEDEIGCHEQDTLSAGDGLCRPESVALLVEEGPKYITQLIEWGTEFDRAGTKLAFTREAAHSRSRILHAHGDSTGREISRALLARAHKIPHLHLRAHSFTTGLILEDGRAVGVRFIDENDGSLHEVRALAVLLATGGLGQIYRETTNPEVATGDGIAIAYEAGAVLSDMEFVQFHPTALAIKGAPRFLLSEALRGEGGILRNILLERFMKRYAEAQELAPRDVVARAIVSEMHRTNAQHVYLDMTAKSAEFLQKRFPRIYSTCLSYGLDLATDMAPVSPAAHYMMGGVKTDPWGHTSILGLYAAGETADTGVHGANRLASNSLLEGLVFGARSGQAMVADRRQFSDKLENGARPVKYKASALPGSPAPRPDSHSHDGASGHATSAVNHSNSSANSSAHLSANSSANLSATSRSAVAHSAKLSAAAASRSATTHAAKSAASAAFVSSSASHSTKSPAAVSAPPEDADATPAVAAALAQIRDLMWRHVGIMRNGKELTAAVAFLENMKLPHSEHPGRHEHELSNLHCLASLMARSALAREESRGSHYRSDFPYRDDDLFQKHSRMQRLKDVAFEP